MASERKNKLKKKELTKLMQQAYAAGDTHKAYEYSRQIRNIGKDGEADENIGWN